MEKTKGKPKP